LSVSLCRTKFYSVALELKQPYDNQDPLLTTTYDVRIFLLKSKLNPLPEYLDS